jgi:hypothetical protein
MWQKKQRMHRLFRQKVQTTLWGRLKRGIHTLFSVESGLQWVYFASGSTHAGTHSTN